jgi:hypothetical protein
VSLREGRLRWFDLRAGRELESADDGIVRLGQFPGLWVDAAALFANDYVRLIAALDRGLATPDHVEFARRLAAR